MYDASPYVMTYVTLCWLPFHLHCHFAGTELMHQAHHCNAGAQQPAQQLLIWLCPQLTQQPPPHIFTWHHTSWGSCCAVTAREAVGDTGQHLFTVCICTVCQSNAGSLQITEPSPLLVGYHIMTDKNGYDASMSLSFVLTVYLIMI